MWYSKLLFLFAVIAVSPISALPTPDDGQLTRGGQFNLYYLYTRDNPSEPVLVRPTAASIRSSPFDPSRDTAVIVHGHRANAFNSLNPTVKNAYLSSYDANVFVVDWEVFAGQSYSNAVDSVPSIGEGIAEFLELLTQHDLQLSRVHLIGFDLGAHVLGFTGRHLHGDIARITGLDPSSSRWGDRSGRLRSYDAIYVEIVHTDGGLTGNGIGTDIGDVDFHPNGGTNQPGCLLNGCDHDRAWELFAASLIYDHFLGRRCTGLQMSLNRCSGDPLRMGNGELQKPGFREGAYRVNTDSRFPF